MVQKEINKKLPIYTLAAILLAVLLIASIYSFSNDSLTPNQGQLNNPNPNNNNNGQVSSMKTFPSFTALKDFLKTSWDHHL